METLSWIVVGLLAAATLRRFGLLLGALLPPQPVAGSEELSVLVVVAARDEARQLEPLLRSLGELDYPAEKLSFVLVDDGSRDRTGEIFERWCRERSGAIAIQRSENRGKSAAIRAALDAGGSSDLLAVYDADTRPRPGSLKILAHAFSDPRVGAASGYRMPLDADRSIISRYAALESWVHQLVVQAGKERWRWNPTTMGGNCIYRLKALAGLGGFPVWSYSEDVEVSLGLIARGWRTRFLIDAAAESGISGSLRHYTNQRIRWSFGMYHSFKSVRGLEALAVASGYADRIAFAAGCLLALLGHLSPLWLLIYLSAPALEALAALAKAGRLRTAPLYFLSAVPMFVYDIVSSCFATLLALAGRRPSWRGPGRPESGS